MPDLIKRLRNRASCGPYMGAEHGQTVFQLKEAADALEAMRDALREAKSQIEYLHDKFAETGSGNGALARIDASLRKLDGKEGA